MNTISRKQTDGKFFQTTKRGEIQELKEELHDKDKAKQKDAVKKVIASMTVGKDVSALFADVVNCIQTDNIELKKLVYLYVMNYAKAQPELAILAINTFRKDASDPNPLIRSLAVRTMGCIRLDQVTEYLLEPLRKCCQDPDPYVRKTSAICIPKVYEINPELVEDQGFLEILKEMLSDPSSMVVANAVAGLAEISESSGQQLVEFFETERGKKVQGRIVEKLMAAINESNEWGQVFILDLLATYTPLNASDAVCITERITARLAHSNPAVVLAAVKVVLKCMDAMDDADATRNLQKKLNPPLVTLLSCEPEVQFVSLRNTRLIVQKRPGILAADVKMFFCKYNDPVYVKLEKVDIMVMLVSEKNMEQVLLELKEYATGVDVEFVRKSVRSIGRVAVKLERACERAISVLLELIETKVNYVVQEATVVIKDIFRKYPSRYEQVLTALCDSLDVLDEPEAKASMIWILGEYAERIENVDEILDMFLSNFHDEQPVVQQQLLTSIVKLFLKKPGSTQDMVSKVLKCSTEETTNYDLRDRGYIYWRLLSTNPESTKTVVLGDKPTIRDDSQVIEKSLLDRLVTDLALMSSVYHKSPDEFITRLAKAGPPDAAVAEEEDEDEEDRAARRREVQKELEREDGGTTNNGGRGGGGGGGNLDLLDLDGGDSSPVVDTSVVRKPVLAPTKAGQNGNAGFAVAAAMARRDGGIQLLMTFSNSSAAALSGFAIQVNKNPFGLAPAGALNVPPIMPGGSADVSLPMNPGVIFSNTPPAAPLFIQVAIKTSLDIFYFNVEFDLPVVLPEAEFTRDQFTQIWQKVGEGQQHVIAGASDKQLTVDMAKTMLKTDNISYIAQRQADGDYFAYFGARTTNGVAVLCEMQFKSGSNGVRLATRTELPALCPLLEAAVCKRLGISPR